MKRLAALFGALIITLPAVAATPVTGRGRASMDSRAAVSKKIIDNATATTPTTVEVKTEESVQVETGAASEKTKDMREREKAACIQNNIGVGSTFVWASRYSNTANYSSMIEDIEFPENNVCFVKVAMKSNDSRIDVSDIPTKYFVMGENITCGQWANEETLKSRILEAKKKGRAWATVGGVVGGAGVGVGAMELFGNKLIGGAVEGQAGIKDKTKLLCSQMKVLKQEKSSKYNDIIDSLNEMKKYCEDATLWSDGVEKPEECKKYDYKVLLDC